MSIKKFDSRSLLNTAISTWVSGSPDVLAAAGNSEAHRGHARSTPSDSMKATARIGWAIILLFFGGFGIWANIAPLNGAVMATGVVKVDGNRKSIQHLDGG